MQDAGLYALYKLHLIDSKLHDLQLRAASLDTGKKDAAAYAELDASSKPDREAAAKASSDLQALVTEQEITESKIQKFEKQMFDGSITNSREIENLQKEIAMLRQHAEQREHRIDAQRQIVPGLQEKARSAETKMVELQKSVAVKRAEAQKEYALIQKAFESAKTLRTAALTEVSADLARRYDSVRQKTGGTGMALITETSTCGHCGMHVAEKSKEFVKLGQVVTCEQCGRILFVMRPEA